MGEIRVDPGQLRTTGAELARAGSGLPRVGSLAATLGRAPDPPATAGALDRLSSAWSAGAEALQAEVAALASSTDAAAFLYADVDQKSMGGR